MTFDPNLNSFGGIVNISDGDGYVYNSNPSIITIRDGSARVVWEGSSSGWHKNIVFHAPDYCYFWLFNYTGGYYDCLNPVINMPDDQSAYFFSWSENNNG